MNEQSKTKKYVMINLKNNKTGVRVADFISLVQFEIQKHKLKDPKIYNDSQGIIIEGEM